MPSFPWAKRNSHTQQQQQQNSPYLQHDRDPTLPNLTLSPSDDAISYDDGSSSTHEPDPRQRGQTFDGILNNSPQSWYRAPSILGGKNSHKVDNSDEYYDQTQSSAKSAASPPRKSFKTRLGLAFTSRDNLADFANADDSADRPTRKKSVLRKGAPSSYRDPGGSPGRGGGSTMTADTEQEPQLPRIPGTYSPEGGASGGKYDNSETGQLDMRVNESDRLGPDAWVQSRDNTRMNHQTTQERPAARQQNSYTHSHQQQGSLDQAQQYGSLTGNRPSSRLGLFKDERPPSPQRQQVESYPTQPRSSPTRQRQDPLGSPMIARQPTQGQGVRPNSSTPLSRGGALSQASPVVTLGRVPQMVSSSPSIQKVRQASQVLEDPSSPITGSGEDTGQQLEVLKTKYMNVKRQYFNQKKQLEQLQESIAQQNLSESRTSLDDGEYTRRLESLDGSIRELAFSIRKHWRSLPPWLLACISPTALQTATASKEMIAAGRAFITRWLYDEIFHQHFHPALAPAASIALKTCQRTLNPTSDNASALSRATTWRLATVDSLSAQLNPTAPAATENTSIFCTAHTQALTRALHQHLVDPLPSDVRTDASIAAIVTAAVGILAHIPLESRDVHLEYYLPETTFDAEVMKAETAVLSAMPDGRARATSAAEDSFHDAREDGSGANGDTDEGNDAANATNGSIVGQVGGILGKAVAAAAAVVGANGTAVKQDETKAEDKDEDEEDEREETDRQVGEKKVRLAVFMSAQVRGRARVLVQAPVFLA